MRILIHIGYHKTGTSFLQENVFEHEVNNINSVSRKLIYDYIIKPHDLHFDWVSTRKKMNSFLDSARLNVISHERLSGQPHFGARDSMSIAHRLKNTFPEAQVLIGIREQKSMLFSLHNQYIKAFGTLSFEQYFNNSNLRGDLMFQKENLKYSALIFLYKELFSPEKVLVLPFEILRKDNVLFLKNLEDFAKNYFYLKPGVVNASSTQVELFFWRKLNPLINYNILHIERSYYNKYLAKIIRAMVRLSRVLSKGVLEKKMIVKKKRSIKHQVGNIYLEDNKKISKIIDFDLELLGYDL